VDLKTVSDVVANFTTTVAVVAGGFWAYFKFARGRTFAARAEMSVEVKRESGGHLRATVTFKNAGLSKIDLNKNVKAVRLFTAEPNDRATVAVVAWKRLLTSSILEEHDWVEAQETVTDSVIFHTPGAPATAYRVEAMAGSPRSRITGLGKMWRASAILVSEGEQR
jgi:hypothetical protein